MLKWKCIRRTLRKDFAAIEKQAVSWNPDKQLRRRRPRRSWRRAIKEETEILGKIWRKVKAIANRIHRSWRSYSPKWSKRNNIGNVTLRRARATIIAVEKQ